MKRSWTYKFIFLIYISSSREIACHSIILDTNKNFFVKVLLSQINQDSRIEWQISSKKGVILRTKKNVLTIPEQIIITRKNNKFYLNNRKLTLPIYKLDAIDGHLKYNGNEYYGSFYLVNKDNSLMLINRVELEDYIFCVLNTESWPGWPLEVNKAFAIASRSYVIAKFLENNAKLKQPYHIKNTNTHQTYLGTHSSEIIRQAVDQTKGIVIGYKKKPILAMFDICCGGIIPANMRNVNFQDAPYLMRKKKCTFCQGCRMYNWQVNFPKKDFENILKKEFSKINNIQSFIVKKDKAGIVSKVLIKDKRSNFSLSGKRFYSLFDKVRSFSFSLQKVYDKIIIKGTGRGHHLGICQWGAKGMVDKGWDYQSILKFYYPNTNLIKLK